MKTYNLFISHSWTYGNQYDRLLELLRGRPYFRFRNYSVPRYSPIPGAHTDAALRQAIRNQMASCHVILILAGVYATYSKWINVELSLALTGFENRKPIIAVAPWGNRRVSKMVAAWADRVVGWNTESVVGAIRDLA